MKKKLKKIALLIILSLVIFIIYGQFKSYRYEKELQKEGIITIGKLDSIEKYPKRSYIHISYYIGKKKYNSFESSLHKKVDSKDIGKFYRIRYLLNSPEIIRGIYSEQIIDSSAIFKAGFSRADVGKQKRLPLASASVSLVTTKQITSETLALAREK